MIQHTWSPLMNQLRWATGLLRPEVQLILTVSPYWYLGRPPVILGPSSGNAIPQREKRKRLACKGVRKCYMRSQDRTRTRIEAKRNLLLQRCLAKRERNRAQMSSLQIGSILKDQRRVVSRCL